MSTHESQALDRSVVYKVVDQAQWQRAREDGSYNGSADDARDGFIHLSTRSQLPGTLAKHYQGQRNLVLVGFSANDLAHGLKWEPSRGGDLFPHFYGMLKPSRALSVVVLRSDEAGIPQVPDGLA